MHVATSVRMHIDVGIQFWADTDPIECKFEAQIPKRMDAFVLKVASSQLLVWERPDFRSSLADDIHPSQVPPGFRGRKRRGLNISYLDAVTDIIDDSPDSSISFLSVRKRHSARETPGEFIDLQGMPISSVKIYELKLQSNAVIRGWTISNLAQDSYDDFDRDPSVHSPLKQELLVYRFDSEDLIEITDHPLLQFGKRIVLEDDVPAVDDDGDDRGVR